MDDRVREFVETSVQTVVGLDAALFYQANPDTFDTSAGIALRTHRSVEEVHLALERLADRGMLERYPRAEGKYTCYGLVRSSDVWHLLCLVSEAYLDDPIARKEIVRMLVGRQRKQRAAAEHESAIGGDNA